MGSMGVLNLDTRKQLLALLAAVPQLADAGGRTMLLAGLPDKLVRGILRSTAEDQDLAAIVTACEQWRSDPVEGANYPTRLLVQNAAGLAAGSATGTALAALLAGLPLTPPTGPPPCPYPGMVPFTAADARFFYGRTPEIAQMVERLRAQHFLLVLGPS